MIFLILATLIFACAFTFFLRKEIVLFYDRLRLRGKYGVNAGRISLDGLRVDGEKFEIETVKIAPEGIAMLISIHGEDIKRHLNGLETMMRARFGQTHIYFTVAARELKILSVSGQLDGIVDSIRRVAYDLGEAKISQIRVCCASNQHMRKALIREAGAIKTGYPSELVMR